jgi:hypothetical protein
MKCVQERKGSRGEACVCVRELCVSALGLGPNHLTRRCVYDNQYTLLISPFYLSASMCATSMHTSVFSTSKSSYILVYLCVSNFTELRPKYKTTFKNTNKYLAITRSRFLNSKKVHNHVTN